MSACAILVDFFINLLAGIVGILVVLWLERQRRPGLTMHIGVPGTIDEADPVKRHPTTFLKVQVHNRTVPRWLAWVYHGEPAVSCAAWMSFHSLDGVALFDREMVGRWSETPDPPPIQGIKTENGAVLRLLNVQDTMDIQPGSYANLDVVCRLKGEEECYGWNNESYLHGWKNPAWRLPKGRYIARIRVKTGGKEFRDAFVIDNDRSFTDFRLEVATAQPVTRGTE
jgi:hypothetical protein